MVREIMKNPLFLAQKSAVAEKSDLLIAMDLAETLQAHQDGCIGMAANMIGERKRIIAVYNGPMILTMINPRIMSKMGAYETEEGCLSLQGVKKTTRYREIKVAWQDMQFRLRTGTFQGSVAQAIQHEIDHCDGILI